VAPGRAALSPLGVKSAVLVIALEERVRAHLEELASERCDF
jgi:hypothetical protein